MQNDPKDPFGATIWQIFGEAIITKITKLSTSPLRISNGERRLINGERRLIIPNSTFVQSCDQIVSSFWSHDFTILLSIYFCIWFLILLSNQVRSFELNVRNSLLNSQVIQT